MKKTLNLLSVALLVVLSSTHFYAQDTDVQRLEKIVAVIEKINAIPVDFALASSDLLPAGAANVQKQAALLKQLPAGATVEVGVHTFAVGNEPKNVILTQARADKVRSLLIAAGVPAASLTAKGYGSSKANTGDPTGNKNRRVEYLVTGSPAASASNPRPQPEVGPSTPVKNAAAGTPVIAAGRGWGRVEIGAARSQVEFILGQPDFFGVDTSKPEESYATYFQKGVVVIYKSGELTVKMVRFIGNAAQYAGGKSKFGSFQGRPDKGLTWKSTPADVIAAYGAPSDRESHEDYPDKVEILTLIYPGAQFMFRGGIMTQINISAGKPVASGAATANAPKPSGAPKKIVDNKSGEELFDAVEKNQVEQVRDMIKRGVGLNFERKDETTLIVAIRNYRTEIARMLLEAGADPEFAESKYGATPLLWAVQMSDYDTLELLIDKYKVNVNKRSKSNHSSLHVAANFGQSNGLTKLLLKAGANPNVINDKGESPLDIARKLKKFDIVATLESVIDKEEIEKQKLAWALMPRAPESVKQTAAVTPTPTPKPKKIYGGDEDDPDEVASIASGAKSAARRLGFELYDEGTTPRQGRNTNSESGGIQQAVSQGTVYQFVIISKDALAINAIMNGALLTVPCNSCGTSISTYSTSVEKSSGQNGYYMLSFQMQVENFQNNYVTFIPKGNAAGAPVKWLLFARKVERK
jgi:OmpA family/Ankyrin repeats (3 copies)